MKTLNRVPWEARTKAPDELLCEDAYAMAIRQFHQDLKDAGIPGEEWPTPDYRKSVFYEEDGYVAIDLRDPGGEFIACYWLNTTECVQTITYGDKPYEENDRPEGAGYPGLDYDPWHLPRIETVYEPPSSTGPGSHELGYQEATETDLED
jgi:hypothetical protein